MARNLTQTDKYIPPELIALTHQAISPEQFKELCIKYDELRLELTSTGELIVMPGTGSKTGDRNAELTAQLRVWTKKGPHRHLLRFVNYVRLAEWGHTIARRSVGQA